MKLFFDLFLLTDGIIFQKKFFFVHFIGDGSEGTYLPTVFNLTERGFNYTLAGLSVIESYT